MVEALIAVFACVAIATDSTSRRIATIYAIAMMTHYMLDGLVPDGYETRFILAATVDAAIVAGVVWCVDRITKPVIDILTVQAGIMLVNAAMGLTDIAGVDLYNAYLILTVSQHLLILAILLLGANHAKASGNHRVYQLGGVSASRSLLSNQKGEA